MKKITIGSKVAYSVQFLKSIFASHSDLARARGVVVGMQKVGDSLFLAKVDWKNDDIPPKVNVKNLAIVGPNTKFCQC